VVHKEFRARKAWLSLNGSSGESAGWRARGKLLLRWAYNLLTLPVARIQLNLLGSQSNREASFLPHLAPEAAARPTPQDER